MEGDSNVYAHSSLWMRPTGEWSINAKMVYKVQQPILRSPKGRLQNPTAGWPGVLSGSGRLSLFRTIETERNRTEPPVNRRFGFEAVPNRSGGCLNTAEWNQENNFCNPPFHLLPRVLQVIKDQHEYATVIASHLPTPSPENGDSATGINNYVSKSILASVGKPEPLRNKHLTPLA